MAKVFLRAYNREIETMIDRGQLDEAIAHGHHILKTFPKHLETYRLLGKAYLESKRYGDAVDVFSRVLASVPNDFVSHVGLSIIRDEENKLDDAIWHMERAFETQPSNAAIQSELQRLYGRRDGVSPPRIRMTRGALAHMYVQGELYPQAIAEIKSVLKEDPGRSDMQALLARASFKSGAKNDAVDAALALLQRLPYALDGNRVLVEVLSADRNENAQAYRQRVVELDPYAAQVTGSVFQSIEVPDAAVSLERLDWNGQPVGMGSDWREAQGISVESGRGRDEQPDWLTGSSANVTPPPLSQSSSPFSFETPSAQPATPAQPGDEIPEFLKAAGWGQSTGAFDESKSMFAEAEPAAAAEPLAQGDLPDWVKAMKPPEPEAAAPAEEEELPDWINKIGTGVLGTAAAQPEWMEQSEQSAPNVTTPADDQPDWLKSLESAPESAQAAQDQPDWLQGLGSESEITPPAAQTDTPDWLKGLGSEPEVTAEVAATDTPDWLASLASTPEVTPQPEQAESLDWLQGLGSEADLTPQPAQTDTPDWLKGLGSEQEPDLTPQPAQTETPDWMAGLASEPTVPATSSDDDWMQQFASTSEEPSGASKEFDFLNELTEEPVTQAPQEMASSSSPVDELGKSEQERDDSFAWLENLAAKQGATEGLLTTPEERLQEEPDWVKQAKGLPTEPAVTPPAVNVGDLGKSEQERDDSFAWLENLAAKQGATEGLLTKPEERLEQEPEWVRMAKGLTGEPPVSQPPVDAEELGKSEQERDDSFAWLENLAAKQGATEGLLTKPEERMEEEPEWVKQAKGLTSQPPVSQPPVDAEELGKSEQERDDSFAWLENLAAKQGATEGLLTKPEERLQEEPEWVKQARSAAPEPSASQPRADSDELGKSEEERDDSFAWLQELNAEQGVEQGHAITAQEPSQEQPEWAEQALSAGPEALLSQPSANVEEPGKGEQVQEDSFAWLEDLPAEQDTQESPLTQPEGHLQEELEWDQQAEPIAPESQALQPSANVEELGKSEQERDDSFAWLENLAAKQGATEGLLTRPEERMDQEPEWVRQAKEVSAQEVSPVPQDEPVMEQPAPVDEVDAWLKNLEGERSTQRPSAADETAIWFKKLEQEETQPEPSSAADETAIWLKSLEEEDQAAAEPTTEIGDMDMPAWMRDIAQDQTAAPESAVPVQEPEPVADVPAEESPIPSWLSDLENEEKTVLPANADDLPAWLRDETGEVVAEPVKIEPTRPTDWRPAEPKQPEIQYSPAPEEEPQQPKIIYSPPLEEPVEAEPPALVPSVTLEQSRQPEPPAPVPAATFEEPAQEPAPQPQPEQPAPARKSPSRPAPEPVVRKGTGMPSMPGTDPTLGTARGELSRSNIPGALESYARLIKKGRFLDEVIHDLREALYRYPVEVNIWQSLGDAYMRANRLQDALDAYTKAEELLR